MPIDPRMMQQIRQRVMATLPKGVTLPRGKEAQIIDPVAERMIMQMLASRGAGQPGMPAGMGTGMMTPLPALPIKPKQVHKKVKKTVKKKVKK